MLVEKDGTLGRHFLTLTCSDNVVLLYSFHLDELLDNNLENIHPDDLDRLSQMYELTRHA